ncbi:Tpr repeat-containing thioredoxin ttl4 [Thalictrum thalictroides]|uniref:Tpr repeat-containing thioredoxin ttl4 n=1 Tax=Thalictrum thalictroides TaxID=46969 RepID=A0A7J6VR08_THATH|nr:Tpr repeat-containing thioredoxin ttl4 [Thalictrum thalictroides]
MGEYSPEKKSGCVSMIYSGIFRRRSFWTKRSTSTGSIPSTPNGNAAGNKVTSPNSKRRRGGSDEAAAILGDDQGNVGEETPLRQPAKPVNKPPSNHPMNHPKNPPYYYQDQGRKPSNAIPRTSAPPQGVGQGIRKVPKEAMGISGELEMMINDHQRSKGSSNLVRASSGNVMLYSSLGNLRQPGAGNQNSSTSYNVLDFLPKTANEMSSTPYGKYSDSNTSSNVATSNVARKVNDKENRQPKDTSGSLCRALSTRMDPEQLKLMGNEDFKEGRFTEALALYEAAISIDPEKAAYRSNKSAALTALGQLFEAVFECREAIKIEPTYHRAHHRLATLYLRLGEAEKALYHYKQCGPEADSHDVAQAQGLLSHLNKCTEARRLRDWNTLLKVTNLAVSSGADSAPQIFALQAEALLKLHRHQEAIATLSKGPQFSADDCTKFFGPIGNAGLLVTRAHVDMAAGRFDDAVEAAQRAARLDSNNRDATAVVKKTRGVASARLRGNDLFKASKFTDACSAYGEGLEHDPLNSVLLCNRAACRVKLGQFDKAVDDLNKALNVRPSYSKARLRRADCYAKLERWEASLEDYEVLIKEMPEDEEVNRGLSEVQAQLKKHRNEESKQDMKTAPNKDHFRTIVDSPGTSVVLFCNKFKDKEETHLIEELSSEYPSVNFVKVDVDDNPHVAESENLVSLPIFRLYKNGSRIKDIPGANHQELEICIQDYCS